MNDASSTPTLQLLPIRVVATQTGLTEPTLRYYEKMGLIEPVSRDESSGHRRYSAETVQVIETLTNLRTAGLSIEDMRRYLRQRARGDEAAAEQKALFQAHADKLAEEIARLQTRQHYLACKVAYWDARARGDVDEAARVAEKLQSLIKELK